MNSDPLYYLVLDIGSNSCKGSLFQYINISFSELYFSGNRYQTCIGKGLDADNNLDSEHIAQCIHDVSAIIGAAQNYLSGIHASLSGVYCFATAAARRAKNKNEFKNIFFDIIHHELNIISPEQEANFERIGVLSSPFVKNFCEFPLLLIDFGGGSTEISWIPEKNNDNGCKSYSLNFGQNTYKTAPALWENIENNIRAVVYNQGWDQPKSIVVAGSAVATFVNRSLSRPVFDRDSLEGTRITSGMLSDCNSLMADMTARAGMEFVTIL